MSTNENSFNDSEEHASISNMAEASRHIAGLRDAFTRLCQIAVKSGNEVLSDCDDIRQLLHKFPKSVPHKLRSLPMLVRAEVDVMGIYLPAFIKNEDNIREYHRHYTRSGHRRASDDGLLERDVSLVTKNRDDIQKYVKENYPQLYEDLCTLSDDEISSLCEMTRLIQHNERGIMASGNKTTEYMSKGHVMKYHPTILWGEIPVDNPEEFAPKHVIVPVGDYGEEFANKIFNATQLLVAIMSNDTLREGSKSIANTYADDLEKIARGRDKSTHHAFKYAPLRALVEGAISLGNTIFLLTAKRKSEYVNSDDLVRAVIENKLPNEIARWAPLGLINPVVITGQSIPNLIVIKNGVIQLSPYVSELWKIWKRQIRSADVEYKKITPSLGMGCPVSHLGPGVQSTGIQQLSEMWLDIYNQL